MYLERLFRQLRGQLRQVRSTLNHMDPATIVTRTTVDVHYLGDVVTCFQEQEGSEYQVVESVIGGFHSRHAERQDMIVLDASYNPPTKAHMNIILSSLQVDTKEGLACWSAASNCWTIPKAPAELQGSPKFSRILLLLAMKNADKAPQEAPFAHRLVMMILFAQDLLQLIPQASLDSFPPIEIGVIKHARFVDKVTTLRLSYPHAKEMVFLAGFDTLKRLFDPRYYGGSLRPLAPFFEGDNRIRCYFRPDCAEWKREQEDYLEDIKEGKREDEGCSREWATKVELIEHGLSVPISSTLARDAVKTRDKKALEQILTHGVLSWVLEQGLYLQPS